MVQYGLVQGGEPMARARARAMGGARLGVALWHTRFSPCSGCLSTKKSTAGCGESQVQAATSNSRLTWTAPRLLPCRCREDVSLGKASAEEASDQEPLSCKAQSTSSAVDAFAPAYHLLCVGTKGLPSVDGMRWRDGEV
jgi:hypothetical protein